MNLKKITQKSKKAPPERQPNHIKEIRNLKICYFFTETLNINKRIFALRTSIDKSLECIQVVHFPVRMLCDVTDRMKRNRKVNM